MHALNRGLTILSFIGIMIGCSGDSSSPSTPSTPSVGPPTRLRIVVQPVGGQSGGTLATQPQVEILDASGNRVTTSTASVTVAIQSGAGGSLGGTMTLAAVSGVATFTNLTLAGTVGVDYGLRFTSAGLTSVDSNNVRVTPGAAAALAIVVQPAGGESGGALTTQPQVEILDASGNRVTSSTASVTVAIQSGAGGTLGGTVTAAAVNGLVTFTNVTLAGPVGVDYVLRFTSADLTSADSNNVTLMAGAAAQLAIVVQPVGGRTGAVLATQPQVEIQDASGNRVTSSGASVTVAIQSGAGGWLGGTVTATAVDGVVTFTDVTLTGTVGVDYVLRFTSLDLTPVDSDDVAVTPVDPVSQAVTTGSSTTIENDAGVRLYVSPNSVPQAIGGGDGTLVFSMEQTTVNGAAVPPGAQLEGNPVLFGPEGFTFAQPIQLSFPRPAADPTREYLLARLDRDTNTWMVVPTLIDENDPDRLFAHTAHLSTWGMFSLALDGRASGRIHFNNVSSDRWVSACVSAFTLAYPEWQGFFDPSGVGTSLSAAGHLGGVTSQADAIVPQGTWWFQATRTEVVDAFGVALADGWIDIGPFTVNQPGGPGERVNLAPSAWLEATVNRDPLWAPCLGTPTPTPGTGVIQIQLSWTPIVDLDLHVIDPFGEKIYYANRDSDSGGHLDRDMICQPTNRLPENVYWGATAPQGTYEVRVHFFGNCGDGPTQVDFLVRTIVDGVPDTLRGTVSVGETVVVKTFTR
jgi:hypothetical protein